MVFGLFNKNDKNNALKISKVLWRQVSASMHYNMDVFNKFIQTPFVAGYTYGFCRMGFSNMGYGTQSEKMYDRWLSYITSPVILNGKFTEVIKIQVNALEQAKALGDDTPVHMFTKGASVGAFDAGLEFFDSYEEEPSPARNLERYLSGFELDWEDNLGILDD